MKGNIIDILSNKLWVQRISGLILALAILLRLKVFLQNRSLFIDELNLSRNILDKAHFDFLSLIWQQHAPPLFLEIAKFSTDLFGNNEYALRLFPFLAGIVSLILFYNILRKVLPTPAMWYALLLFGFSIYHLQHSTEIKQYSTDVLMGLLCIWMIFKMDFQKRKSFIILGVTGAIGLWISMPLAFILLAIGFYFLQKQYEQEGLADTSFWGKIFLISLMWLTSFAALYWLSLRHSLSTEGLQVYHRPYSMELPFSWAAIQQCGNRVKALLDSIVGPTALAQVWGLLCLVIGGISLWKKDRGLFLLFMLPVFATWLASMFHLYSLIVRLTLFLFPLVILTIAFGTHLIFSWLWKLRKSWSYLGIALGIVAVFISLELRSGIPYFFEPFVQEDPRSVMLQLSKHPEASFFLYVTNNAVPAHDFYTRLYEPAIEIPSSEFFHGEWYDQLPKMAEEWKERGIKKVWILDSHSFGDRLEQIKREIEMIGQVEATLEAKEAKAYLIGLY